MEVENDHIIMEECICGVGDATSRCLILCTAAKVQRVERGVTDKDFEALDGLIDKLYANLNQVSNDELRRRVATIGKNVKYLRNVHSRHDQFEELLDQQEDDDRPTLDECNKDDFDRENDVAEIIGTLNQNSRPFDNMWGETTPRQKDAIRMTLNYYFQTTSRNALSYVVGQKHESVVTVPATDEEVHEAFGDAVAQFNDDSIGELSIADAHQKIAELTVRCESLRLYGKEHIAALHSRIDNFEVLVAERGQ